MACVPVTCCELFLEHLKIPCSSFFLGHIQDLQALSKQTGNEFEPLATAFTKWYAPWGTIKKRYFVLDAYFLHIVHTKGGTSRRLVCHIHGLQSCCYFL